GGIGGRLILQAEQALRAALCGPGGTALADGSFARSMAPFELPRCIQSVYFDFDQADVENVRRSTADLPAGVVDSTRQIGDLAPLSGESAQTGIDVFLAFSAAGGTGAGIFLDLLRLIAHVHEEHNGSESDLAIYPLLVLPSAFPTEGKPKDRRFHELNAGL